MADVDEIALIEAAYDFLKCSSSVLFHGSELLMSSRFAVSEKLPCSKNYSPLSVAIFVVTTPTLP